MWHPIKNWILKNNIHKQQKKEIKRVFSGVPEDEDLEQKRRRQRREVGRIQDWLKDKE
ncbi:MAG: hypothetical protein U9P90_01510 [Patescibacteria group bacterium]|nr:hypothetical protein [Patescibacteria group bacterium]